MVCGPGEGKPKTGERRGLRLEQRADPKPEFMQAMVVARMMKNFLVCLLGQLTALGGRKCEETYR